jgi:hypothetical protein
MDKKLANLIFVMFSRNTTVFPARIQMEQSNNVPPAILVAETVSPVHREG